MRLGNWRWFCSQPWPDCFTVDGLPLFSNGRVKDFKTGLLKDQHRTLFPITYEVKGDPKVADPVLKDGC
jgi:hypothetical protein